MSREADRSDSVRFASAIGAHLSDLLTRWRSAGSRRIERALDLSIAGLRVVWSKDGPLVAAAILLVASAFSGWVDTPLQGVIRGYALSVRGDFSPAAGLVNRPEPFCFAELSLLALAFIVSAPLRRGTRRLDPHLAAAFVLVLLCFPAALVFRNSQLIESLVRQNGERQAIRRLVADSYSASLPPLHFAGTATLSDRAESVARLIGYGWWFALVAAVILCLGCVIRADSRSRRMVFLWIGVGGLTLGTMSAQAVVAEYLRLEGEALYAAGQYASALARFQQSEIWAPDLRENEAFEYRVGATKYWLGDLTSPEARFFLSQNRAKQGESEQAELDLRLALETDPGWQLARHKLAQLSAERGLAFFVQGKAGMIERWLKAFELDETMVRIPYYLTHAYYHLDGQDQSRAIATAEKMVSLVADRGVLSDLYARLGDSYFKAHQDAKAREMYVQSMDMVPLVVKLNLAAQKGMMGL